MDRRDLGGWLTRPGATTTDAEADRLKKDHYLPGSDIGLPAQGAGAVASFGRRLAALCVDWLIALLIAHGVMRPLEWGQWAPLAALLVMNLLLVGTAGTTIGHRMLGLRVQTLTGDRPSLVQSAVRAVLLVLAVPPLLMDRDNRGLHDRPAGTVVVNSR